MGYQDRTEPKIRTALPDWPVCIRRLPTRNVAVAIRISCLYRKLPPEYRRHVSATRNRHFEWTRRRLGFYSLLLLLFFFKRERVASILFHASAVSERRIRRLLSHTGHLALVVFSRRACRRNGINLASFAMIMWPSSFLMSSWQHSTSVCCTCRWATTNRLVRPFSQTHFGFLSWVLFFVTFSLLLWCTPRYAALPQCALFLPRKL